MGSLKFRELEPDGANGKLTRYMVFESWHHLMAFMIGGLELESRLDSKPAPKLRPKLDTS